MPGSRSNEPAPRGGEPAPRRIDLLPTKPGEFQKFVEAATGRPLPLFGASFFVDAANSLVTVDNVPVSSDYTVGPGDEVMIRAWGAIDIDYGAMVDRNGQVNLPKVGSFTKPARAVIVLGATLAGLLASSIFVIARRYRAQLHEQDPESAQAWARLAKAWRLRSKNQT